MIKITRNNYEEFFIDYFDGNLDNHQVAELMLFLAQNSDLDNEFNQFKFVELKDETVSFNLKSSIKKQDLTITGSVFYDRCIDILENNLHKGKIINFNNEIKSDKYKKNEFDSFKKTIIKPDLNIKFSDKDKLKQKVSTVFKLKRVYQYAAVLIAVFISYTLIQNNTELKQISNNTTNKQITSVVGYGELSSFDKYDNQQAFTVIKRETPKIVAKSNSNITNEDAIIKPIYIDKLNAKLIVVDENFANNNTPEYRTNKSTFYISKTKTKEAIEDESILNNIVNDNERKCNPTMVKSLTNEIKSDIYISEMMMHYKNTDAKFNKENTKTVWEFLGEKLSEFTGTNMEKTYDKNGEVSRLAVNNNRFRVSKKIRK